MSFTAQTEDYWEELPSNEWYTSFKLDLTEYPIFRRFYQQLKSTFLISNSDHQCHLEWTTISAYSRAYRMNYDQAVVRLQFPNDDCKFDGMKIVVSIIDNNGKKKKSKSLMKRNDESSFTFQMTDKDDYNSDDTILEYLHNGTLTLFCELIHTHITRIKSIPIDNTQIHAASFYDNVAKEFKELFENGDLCDFTIVVDDTKFHAHKIVVAAISPVFDAMFTTGMKEQIENLVTITDIDGITFKAFLAYMYTGTIFKRNDGFIHNLLMVADKYEAVGLINLCKAYKANDLNSLTQHYWRQCPNKKENTSIIRNLKRFVELREFHLSSTCQFVITNTDYECELKIEHNGSDEVFVHVRFPEDCKLILKVIVSFIDGWRKKLKTESSMKPEQTASLKFSMGNCNKSIHSDSGDLTILCEIIYVDLTPITSTVIEGELQDRNWSKSIKKKIELLFNDKCFSDVTVVVEDVQIYAHKAVLAANSPVFKSMFSGNAVEQIENTITVDDSNATTVKALLTFMYTGSVVKTEQLVRDLLILAEKYQVHDLVTLCQNYEEIYLNPDNVNALIAS